MITLRDILNKIIQQELDVNELYSKVCTVISVDETERSCEVSPIDGGANITKVRLQSSLNGNGGVLQIPTIDSIVICTFINPEKAFVSLYSEVSKTIIEASESEQNIDTYTLNSDSINFNADESLFNDGDNGGLIKIEDLVTRINELEDIITQLQTDFNTWIVVPSDGGGALKTLITAGFGSETIPSTTKADFENTKVKH